MPIVRMLLVTYWEPVENHTYLPHRPGNPSFGFFPQHRGFALALLAVLSAASLHSLHAEISSPPDLQIPRPGDYKLYILSPTVLELFRVNTKAPDPAHVDSWDWVDAGGNFSPPPIAGLKVMADGQPVAVTNIGFKRRPFYAPQANRDLRIGNHLFLELGAPVMTGQSVLVTNDGSWWAPSTGFSASADPFRYNPAIHVNQEGYLPTFPKKAIIGYYMGNLGELPVLTNQFYVVDARTHATAYSGSLTLRQDAGFTFLPTPYQAVFEADFSAVTTPGQYEIQVPGMGVSMPFRIDEGIGMDFARTYALGMFHQRSGYNVAMPFTRFTHAADHLDSAAIPFTNGAPYTYTWTTISNYAAGVNPDNPPQTAPVLGSPAAQLYPPVNSGPISVSGGHFEAGDYSKPSWNSAQLIHVLIFAADSVPGVASLDNLGIPESGDGIGDVLQEAKWEADFLVKMQDADGGFFYQVYPRDREYESDVLPEDGDPQVLWPKNTASTAAAVAALAQCGSSPHFKQAFPAAASNYLAKAQLGWQFLTNAIAAHGAAGAYQKIMHFDDDFTDQDELAWASAELFAATGNASYQARLQALLPDPTDLAKARWGWWRMFACYGNAIRAYATASTSGRLGAGQLDAGYLAKCVNVITNAGNDVLQWSRDNAYGSSFPDPTKPVRSAGWYFSLEQAFDMMVAQLFHPNPAYVDAIVRNLNYEAGCNPVNVTYLTGLGWRRQREVVDQYSANDRRVLPKDGLPVSNMQEGFVWTFTYTWELSPLCFPSDGAQSAPYAPYDRWCDFFNVTTEASTTDTVRSYAVALWLAAQTGLTNQAWRYTNATIVASTNSVLPGQPVTVGLQVADTNLAGARIVWEAQAQEPTFGGLDYTLTPGSQEGPCWIEAEVQWPDGRRAFATNVVNVSNSARPKLLGSMPPVGGAFSFTLLGAPGISYVVQASVDLKSWQALTTNTVPAGGSMVISDNHGFPGRFYRALKAP